MTNLVPRAFPLKNRWGGKSPGDEVGTLHFRIPQQRLSLKSYFRPLERLHSTRGCPLLNLTHNKKTCVIIQNTFNARKDGLFASVARETFGTRVESLSKDFGGIIFESLVLWQFVAASDRRLHKCNKVSWMYEK